MSPVPKRKLVQKTGSWPHWATPTSFLDKVRRMGPIELDPCASEFSRGRVAALEWTEADDGLARDWTGRGLVFCNPVYGTEIQHWALKLEVEGCDKGTEIVALLPSRTDARWWHNLVDGAQAGCFVKGRVQFDNPPPDAQGGGSNLPSFVCYWGPRVDAFLAAFADAGLCVRLRPWRAH
jgi:phage N-6-adenine-methyltransferase